MRIPGLTCVLVVLVLGTSAPAGENKDPAPANLEASVAADRAMEAAGKLMNEGKHAEAVGKYKEALTQVPDHRDALYNGGLAGFLGGDFKYALQCWQRLKTLNPEDHEVRAKLVQTHQALKDTKARDAERQELFALRAKSKDEKFLAKPYYCREQFETSGKHLMVFEFFNLEGERAVRYRFSVLDESRSKEDFCLSLGSYEMTNALARESGRLKKGQRLFHLDGYYNRGSEHRTFAFYEGEPAYDDIRETVSGILAGKIQAQSSSRASGGDEAKKDAEPAQKTEAAGKTSEDGK